MTKEVNALQQTFWNPISNFTEASCRAWLAKAMPELRIMFPSQLVHISDHLSSGYPHVEQRWRVSCSVSSRQGRLYVTAIPLTPSWKWDKKQEIYNMVNNPDMLSYNHVRKKNSDSNDNVSEKPRCDKGRHHQLWFVWGEPLILDPIQVWQRYWIVVWNIHMRRDAEILGLGQLPRPRATATGSA